MTPEPHREARNRQQERAANVEGILEAVDLELDEHAYSTNSHDIVSEYGSSELALANETESVADALDRIVEQRDEFASAEEAREAFTAELRRDQAFDEQFTNEPATE